MNIESTEGNENEGELIAKIENDLVEANKLLCGEFSREVFDEVIVLLEDGKLLDKIGTLSNPDQAKELETEYNRLVGKAMDAMKAKMMNKLLKVSAHVLDRPDSADEARA